MNRRGWLVLAICMLGGASGASPADPPAESDLGISVPAGFQVSLYADDDLAHDIYSMTIDSRGRVVVAGAGYVKILEDTDGDGRADRATLFADRPASGAHGMAFDGNDLVCTGDDSVMRLRDSDGDGKADGPPEVLTRLRHPEHGANGVIRGPDGAFYVICGNDAGVSEQHATRSGSPVKEPRCGGVVRLSRDGKQAEVLAHGFRNPYDVDINWQGHLLTVDSDGERDHYLPWYAPTRLFDIALGMEHGWLLQGWTRGWNRPQSFFDNVERLVEIGRGSPTGVVVYRHRQFPERYRDGVFSACWTLGRVYYFPLRPDGASYSSGKEIFLQTTGTVGFSPCDLAVGPAGDLFVAIGGRRTRGAVFRVRYTAGVPVALLANEPLTQVLAADQPLNSWSRARWEPLVRQLGAHAFADAARDNRLAERQRVRAVEVLVDLFDGVSPGLARGLIASDSAALRARVAWALAHGNPTRDAQQAIADLTHDGDARVQRGAWEALLSLPAVDASLNPQPNWDGALASGVRRVRAAAIATARQGGAQSFLATRQTNPTSEPDSTRRRLAELWIRHQSDQPPPQGNDDFDVCSQAIASGSLDPVVRLEAVRLMQLKLGDLHVQPGRDEVFCGYLGRSALALDEKLRQRLGRPLAQAFPTSDAELDRELARLLGMLGAEQPGLLAVLTRQSSQQSSPQDDLHYLIVSALLPGQRSGDETAGTAAALVGLAGKMESRRWQPSRNWPLRVGELFAALCARDPALPAALVEQPAFGHADHVTFADRLRDEPQRRAVRKLASADEVPAELIPLLASLPDAESLPILEKHWQDVVLHDAIVQLLARSPRPVDRARFVEALSSVDPSVIQIAAGALLKLPAEIHPADVAAALAALRQACTAPQHKELRAALVQLLRHWTGQRFDVQENKGVDLAAAYAPWFDWFVRAHPKEAATLRTFALADAQAWRERLAKIAFDRGDVLRGRKVFEARACHRCHQTTGHLGPELTGAAVRMSRDDLLTAILDPSKEVSPTYQTTLVATESGKTYQGLVVYESPESTLLQTGPDTTVRIAGDEKITMRPSRVSLMPSGLLDNLSDKQIADLMAYVKSLAKPAKQPP